MATLQLSSMDARLTFLALQYHLARPGSELDPETRLPAQHGLGEVAAALEPQLERAVATIELQGPQHERLGSAIAGAINELKAYALLDEGRRTTVPTFHETLRRLFPQVADDPDEASQLAGHLLALRRRIERSAVEDAPPRPPARSRWRFWERGGR
jgi:hypothetical protein